MSEIFARKEGLIVEKNQTPEYLAALLVQREKLQKELPREFAAVWLGYASAKPSERKASP